MTYSSRSRDAYRLGVTAVTGVAVAGTLAATGWLAGAAAHAPSADATTPSGETGTPGTVIRHRPTGVKVTNRYVTKTGAVSLGNGGTVVTSPATPVTPAPPPAPSSGS